MTLLREITGFRIVTAEPARLTRFYTAIGFAREAALPISMSEMTLLGLKGGGERTMLRMGAQQLALDSFENRGRPYPSNASACDALFQHFAIVTNDIATAWQQALAAGASPISVDGPVALPASSGGVTAIKFRDPEGHPLEYIQFAGGPESSASHFQGIDHSAIACSDIGASRSFYEGMGLHCENPTLNSGATQAALDGLAAPIVDVIPLMPLVRAPHLELLCYREPRSRPCSWQPNDIVATRMCWAADEARLVVDPDGHLHQLSC